MGKIVKQVLHIAFLKTIWFNLRYFPLNDALKMPVIIAKGINVRYCYKGFCEIIMGVKTGILRFGFGDRNYNADVKGSINIKGKLLLKGQGVHAFGPGVILNIGKNGVLTLGDNFTASARNTLSCSCSISVGDDNMWSFDNVIMDSDAHQLCDESDIIMNYNKPITFGNHVWLGCRNIVMKGTSIPDGCMVASGSKLSGIYTEQNAIITSHNKVIKSNIRWKRNRAINK